MTSNCTGELTASLANYFSGLALEHVPPAIQRNAKLLLLDTVGCMIAATKTSFAPIAYGSAEIFGSGDEVSVVGQRPRTSVAAAVYANARLGNCMDMDETFPVGHHFGVGAVTAALALAECNKRNGADTLLAIIAGYELGGRLASAAGPPMKVTDGRVTGYPDLYSFSTSVVFAAAGTALSIMNLDEDAARQTLGIAGSNAPVPVMSKWSESVDLPDCKYCDAGWCTLAGVFAARAASLGATGFESILDGSRGLIRMSGTENFDPDTLVGGFGEHWMLSDMTYKPWPTCRWTHQPLTALAALLERETVDWRDIRSIKLETNRLVCTPRFQNPTPRTFSSRQFSLPHMVAMLALGVPVGPEWLDSKQDDDPRVTALRRKVQIVHWDRADEFAEHIVRGQIRTMPARATVELGDRTLSAETEFAQGDPWHSDTAYGEDRVIAKFRTISGLDSIRCDRLIDQVLSLEQMPDPASIIRDLGDS